MIKEIKEEILSDFVAFIILCAIVFLIGG